MRPTLLSLSLAAFFLFACEPQVTEPLPTPAVVFVADSFAESPPAPAIVPQRALELRVALPGEPTLVNAWALFGEPGADYWSKATQGGYWPSLYHLAPPSFDLQPAVAKGPPAPILCDTASCTASVTLQPGLSWTDGSALTAADVAFTVNTALQFRLGLNWRAAYDPAVLDRAEVLDDFTVRFYFKSKPSVADWQYGALLGPVVNRAYWQPRIQDALDLRPEESLLTEIQELEAEIAWRETDLVNMERALAVITPESTAYVDTTRKSKHMQDDLTGLRNKLGKKLAEYELKLSEARKLLLAIESMDEPTLGPWKFANTSSTGFVNQAHPGTPFGNPWFGSIRYLSYPSEPEAVEALLNGEIDLILTPDGLSAEATSVLAKNTEISLWANRTRSARFLAFNHADPLLADPVLHQALACMLDPEALMESLGGNAAPLSAFVLDDFWRQGEASLPCFGFTGDARLSEAIRLLKVAGYSWESEPAYGVDGSGLKDPGGRVLPTFTLLTLEREPMRELAALYILQQGRALGLSLDVRPVSKDELLYEVYSSRNYDLALMGWHLSAYPSYLCEWFMPLDQNPFAYNGIRSTLGGGARLAPACEAWSQVTDLDMAKAYALEVQSVLMGELPLIPLYTSVRVDAFRNIRYPFARVVDGLGGLYGATGLAIPLP